jgi:hypothetical protein
MLVVSALTAAEPDHSRVPGVVIAHTPASSRIYFGSPGIAVVRDGVYLAKCDEFGPGSTEHVSAVSHVFRSEDTGRTWRHVARIDGLFWASVFMHRGAAYLLGTDKHHGRVVVMRSDDAGDSWTKPTDPQHGLLTPPEGAYHTAPVPIVEHAGRLWRGMEDATGGTEWGKRYQALMMSAPVDADLLRRESWTFSNVLPRDPAWLEGKFGAWLEGNAVATPGGEIVDVLRVHNPPDGGRAAVVRISADGARAEFDSQRDFIEFPGGAKKFTIRYDPQTKLYWSLSNWVPPRHKNPSPQSTRNTLALVSSPDLREWTVRCVVLHHADVKRHAFQYVDWLFDGDDLIAVSRTAYDDGVGGARNAHDANYLTFHRIGKFRTLTPADAVVDFNWLQRSEHE